MTLSELNTTLQQLRLHFNGTLKENQDSLRTILETLSDLVDSLAQAKVKTINWKYYSQTLVNKIIFTSYSIIQLSEGYVMRSYKTKDLKVDVTDYQSIYILTRALIENYVTLCYITITTYPRKRNYSGSNFGKFQDLFQDKISAVRMKTIKRRRKRRK